MTNGIEVYNCNVVYIYVIIECFAHHIRKYIYIYIYQKILIHVHGWLGTTFSIKFKIYKCISKKHLKNTVK